MRLYTLATMTHIDVRKLGLIGLGNFGCLVVEHLRDHFAIVAADELDRAATAEDLGTIPVPSERPPVPLFRQGVYG